MGNEPRRRGHPRLDPDDESVDIHLKLPSRQYDRLYLKAKEERMTIPEVIRRALREITNEQP